MSESDPKQEPQGPKKEPATPATEPQQPAADPMQPSPMESLQAELAALKQQQADIMAAVSALANQGAVNASVVQDNGNGSEDDYPMIDLAEINRLIGA